MERIDFRTGTFYLGDCFDVMATLPAGGADMVLCDLPYGTTQNKWDSVLPLGPLWADYWRLLKSNGPAVLTAQCPFDKVLGASHVDFLKYEWIWSKSKATGHLNAKKQPLKEHENVLVFYREQCFYDPQGLVRKEVPTIRKGRDNGRNYGSSAVDAIQEFENYPRSVLQFPSVGATIHPTQKPVALFEYLIRTYTRPGELVLDNTAGSGTTAIAAINSGRRWICIERDPDYFAKAVARVFEAEWAVDNTVNPR